MCTFVKVCSFVNMGMVGRVWICLVLRPKCVHACKFVFAEVYRSDR